MHSYEQWTRSEIDRLRADAQKASAEADTLQRAFDKWLELNGQKIGSPNSPKPESPNHSNGHATPSRRAGRKSGYGNKNAFALDRIRATPSGITTEELFEIFAEKFGPKYKRSSMRSLLWSQKKIGTIEIRNGRYVIASGQNT